MARKSARRFDPLAVTAEIVAIAFWCDLPTPNLVATNASDLPLGAHVGLLSSRVSCVNRRRRLPFGAIT